MSEAPVAWYPVADHPPPLGVKVMIKWGARPGLVAALVEDERTRSSSRSERLKAYEMPRVAGRRVRWLADDNGRPVLLPCDWSPPDPRSPWIGWHTLQGWPEWWRPLRSNQWKWPLPAPGWIETGEEMPVRLWSATQRFQAVEDAEAAELAAEMEADREHFRDTSDARASSAPVQPSQWWRDPFAVTYSEPGSISCHEAEGRLMRAFNAEHWVRVERPGDPTFAEALARMSPAMLLSAADLAADDVPPLRLEPTGRDRDDMLTALGWLQALGIGDLAWKAGRRVDPANLSGHNFVQQIGEYLHIAERVRMTKSEVVLRLRERDPPLSWRRIGKIAGLSHERVRQVYDGALERVTATANGEITEGAAAIAARLDAVRDGNRAARRRERQ